MKSVLLACLLVSICTSFVFGTNTAMAEGSLSYPPAGITHDWSDDFTFPTEDECGARSEEAGNAAASLEERSPYLAAWLSIDRETRYDEYCVDIKADYLPAGTYCCGANWTLDLSGLKKQYKTVEQDSISGYAGLQRWEENAGYGAIMSLWDIECTGYDGKVTTIRPEQTYPTGIETHRFGHEGNGANSITPYDWQAGRWYRMLLKCGTSKETGSTTVEQWLMDMAKNEWTHICTFDTGVCDTCFIGPCAFFLENYLQKHAGEVRSMEVANVRIHDISDGGWHDVTATTHGFAKQFGTGRWQAGADKHEFYMITSGVPGSDGQLGKPLSVTNAESGKPYQELPAQYKTCFQDVPSDTYYASPVGWALQHGITNGTSKTTFSPEQTCTRGQIITFLWRASGSPEPKGDLKISDIKAEDYYYKAVLWAAENGMFSGTIFAPNDPCTRAMAVEFMWKQAGSPSAGVCEFDDVPSNASCAQAVAWALSMGITNGTSSTTFSPDGTCTRGQIVTFIYRAAE